MENHPSFHLGPAIVDPMRCLIRIHEQEKHVEPQVMGVLLRLVADPGEVITREELLQSAWPDTIVNDGALSKAISVLRKALGDNARRPLFIETIPKIGYRVIAQVEPVADRPVNPADSRSAPPRQRIRAGSEDQRKKNVFNVRLKELTVAQLLLLLVVIGLVSILWPRPQQIELEEEIVFVTTEGVSMEVVDSLRSTMRPVRRNRGMRLASDKSVDTLILLP